MIVFFRNKTGKEQMAYRRVINSSYRKFAMLIIVSTIPTGIIGYFCKDVVEMASEILIVPGICLIATAVLLLIADHCKDGDKLPKNVTYTDAFSVGIAQGIATLPGLSRSGTTITACLLAGYQRNFAVKYSFLMSIPAILGALVLELKDATDLAVSGTEVVYYVIGMAVAAVVGYICIERCCHRQKFTFCHLLSARWRIVHRRVFLSGITVLEVSKFWQQGIKRVHLGNERHRQAGREVQDGKKKRQLRNRRIPGGHSHRSL